MVPVIAILSGERMNTIMLLGFIVLVLIKYRFIYLLYFFSILVIFIFILKNYNFLDNLERVGYIFDRYFNLLKVLNNDFIDKSYWGNHFIAAINIFKENFLFGIGINMFSIECLKYVDQFKYACANHPHNIYLEIASEAGILSLTLFLIIIANILKIFFIYFFKKKFNIVFIIILSLSICILIYAFPFRSTGSFFNNYNSSFFWVFLGLLIELNENKKKI